MSDFRSYSELFHSSMKKAPTKFGVGVDGKWLNFLNKLSQSDVRNSKIISTLINKAYDAFPGHPEKYNPTSNEWEACQREYRRLHSPKGSSER